MNHTRIKLTQESTEEIEDALSKLCWFERREHLVRAFADEEEGSLSWHALVE